uniref:Formylglycine-generating enzyme, required for sulfatase activity, contains SUMF1/FGE domain n=1 Tax=Candidatus Kentrum sp. FM TaxID=2126340 RepID=A0A450VRF1_9GAMM|nr:MAG: Formylglycine-generating enzyme, required for sulfatase activity, contains SUMF1/FGE domain [Candidatus Kentron sp. FM]VFJ43927.1 MAG: Formylglycine-generating enzyme, required for sulfatase activity, contains SUMF1/FGE domain [Candidatus Kentron sp. FM]VFK07347.1 MAG: Formylglycine-generating enzyme, required for sulfatase activity, contains SUMF1/FGE domain [Candidatus Kentron sp. FM]
MPDTSADRCPNCFEENQGDPTCPHCGWTVGDRPDSPLYLAPGTPLGDDYVIGRVLGHGGFGITYLGWDSALDTRVAIKEFLPDRLASRGPQPPQVDVYPKQKKLFDDGLARFQEEARILAGFQHYPGIVTVFKFLSANGTGYMVMAFVEGITLGQYLKSKGDKIPWQQALAILTPVMDALRETHGAGLLHRDICPDNIYITHDRQVKLLDFGAARRATEKTLGLNAMLKEGYAPDEQYRSNGQQGAWTDVYGLCATLYRCVTGQLLPPSLDRIRKDGLQPPSTLGVSLPEGHEAALLKGLAVDAQDRWQSIEAMQDAFGIGPPPPPPPPRFWPFWKKMLIVLAVLLLLTGFIGIGIESIPRPAKLTVQANVPEAMVYIDGEKIGLSGIKHEIDAGEHTVRVEKSGYEPVETRVALMAGEEGRILRARLSPRPARLVIASDFPDATVHIDGKAVGSPGIEHTLAAGEYTVRVERPGYEPVETRITLEPGGKRTIRAELIPKKAKLVIRSRQENDMAYINDKEVGPTGRKPHILAHGEYTIRVEKEGFAPFEEWISLAPGEQRELRAKLEPIPEFGSRYKPGRSFRDKLQDGSPGPRMMVIPAGMFRMGSPPEERNRDADEGPQHQVRIPRSFAMGVTEVTFEDYDRFTAATGRELSDDHDWGRGRQPVINVSWSDAVAYAKWLSAQSGQEYRLPTEAEWEYAARAGTTSPYPWGTNETSACAYANSYDVSGEETHHKGWDSLSCDDGWANTAPVGSYPANDFGLFDISGNVWEWTADCWHEDYQGAPTDGTSWGKEDGGDCTRRVARGGSLFGKPWFLRSANRFEVPMDKKAVDLGFRLVRTLKP